MIYAAIAKTTAGFMNSFWRVIDLPSWVVCLVLLTLLSIKGIGSSWTKGFSVDHVLMFEPYPWHKLLVLQSRIVNKMCRAQNLVLYACVLRPGCIACEKAQKPSNVKLMAGSRPAASLWSGKNA